MNLEPGSLKAMKITVDNLPKVFRHLPKLMECRTTDLLGNILVRDGDGDYCELPENVFNHAFYWIGHPKKNKLTKVGHIHTDIMAGV